MDEQNSVFNRRNLDAVFNQTAISRVLVLDDSRAQRKLLSAILGRWGFEVIEAACGKDALEICKVERIQLIISDWMMPGMSGLEFCRAYRALDLEYYGYFILLTSKSEKQEVARGLDVGADDFLTKPFHASELRARIAAAGRILSMEQQLQEKNRLVQTTLEELQGLYENLDRDLIEARKLQQSLVPDRFRDFDGTHVSLLLHQSGHVGGDLVGLFQVSETQIGLFAIDVSGHGISSALMTARLAGYLSGATPDQNLAMTRREDGSYQSLPPGTTTARLNKLSLEEMETEHYFTLLLAHVDLQTGLVTMTQAGQPHPVLQRANGSIEFLGKGGLPVGLVPGVQYDDFKVQLAPGDRLLLYSDGISECEDQHGKLFDEAGLAQFLKQHRAVRGASLLDAMIKALQSYSKKEVFPDEVSAVLLEFSAQS